MHFVDLSCCWPIIAVKICVVEQKSRSGLCYPAEFLDRTVRAIKVIDNVVVVGGFIPSPADIIAIKPQHAALPRLEYVPVYCADHRLGLVDGPYSPPFMVCRNVGCDYNTDTTGD